MTPTPNPSFDWRDTKVRHIAHVDILARNHLSRHSRDQRHPVWDFVFEYYPVEPGQLRRWSPGIGVELPGATAKDISHLKFFILDTGSATDSPASKEPADTASGTTRMDVSAYVDKRGKMVTYIGSLLRSTHANPAHFDCLGLHKWTMVYRQLEHRCPEPLRLDQADTNEIVEAYTARCTHFDAFRFFTPGAMPLNEFASTRETQPYCEQMGCLHANMDLYKWATKPGETVPGDLWVDTFEPAHSARELGMHATPYDLQNWGFAPIRIETPEGKAEYIHRQRKLNTRADVLHGRLLEVIDVTLSTQ